MATVTPQSKVQDFIAFLVTWASITPTILSGQDPSSDRMSSRIEGAWVASSVFEDERAVDEAIGMIVVATGNSIFLIRPIERNELGYFRLSKLRPLIQDADEEELTGEGVGEIDETTQRLDFRLVGKHAKNAGLNFLSLFEDLEICMSGTMKFGAEEFRTKSVIKCRRLPIAEAQRRIRPVLQKHKSQLATQPCELLLNWMEKSQ